MDIRIEENGEAKTQSSIGYPQSPHSESEGYRVQLEIFEGPLDLLLHLIRTQEIDLYDIPIAQITDQYLRYLQIMKDLNITLAGEFLLMAATLIYIKSRMLLPAESDTRVDEAVEDPRQEFVEQLVEHDKFRNATQLLYERETVELSVWPRGGNEFEQEEKETVAVSVFDLIRSFHEIVGRYKEQIVLEIKHDPMTLEEKLVELRRLLRVQPEFSFSLFFQRKISRSHLVITLLALLELVKQKEIRLYQKSLFSDIRIMAC